MEPSLSLSMDWNIFSAPEVAPAAAEPVAPELAEPDAPEPAEPDALGAAVVPLELPLEALSPYVWAASGKLKAAATAAAIKVFMFIVISPLCTVGKGPIPTRAMLHRRTCLTATWCCSNF
jgi:hypothetical protein